MRKWKLLHQQLHLPWNQKGSLYTNYIGMTTSNVSLRWEIQASCFQWRLERTSVFLPIKRKSVEKSVDPKLDVKKKQVGFGSDTNFQKPHHRPKTSEGIMLGGFSISKDLHPRSACRAEAANSSNCFMSFSRIQRADVVKKTMRSCKARQEQ